MKADAFLANCTKARVTGQGTWIACCPAHPDKNPSMTVRELNDGRVLVHCFAGCSVEEILGAVGMDFNALFPEELPKSDYIAAMRRPFPAADVLAALSNELLIITLIALDMEKKREISDADIARLQLSRIRIETGMKQALGLHLREVRDVKRG